MSCMQEEYTICIEIAGQKDSQVGMTPAGRKGS